MAFRECSCGHNLFRVQVPGGQVTCLLCSESIGYLAQERPPPPDEVRRQAIRHKFARPQPSESMAPMAPMVQKSWDRFPDLVRDRDVADDDFQPGDSG